MYICRGNIIDQKMTMKNFKPKAWMLPQTVLVIGTYDKEGKPNAMNAAWSGQWDADEIMISMGAHATTDNLNANGDFTVAFATKETMVAADYVGLVSAKKDPDKIKKTGWTIVKGDNVNAPIFKEFPMTLECRTKERLQESSTGFYLIGKIVNIVVDERYIGADGLPDVEKMGLIALDPIHHYYMAIGEKAGNAFADGNKLK